MHLPTISDACHPRCTGWSLCHEPDAVRERLAARRPEQPDATPTGPTGRKYAAHHAFLGVLFIIGSACAKLVAIAMV